MPKPIEHDHKVGDLFYRIDDRMYSYVIDADREEYGSYQTLVGSTYHVVKVTPKGVWLEVYMDKPRFVCQTWVKQFAHPTKELALKGFQARKRRQQTIYQARADRAKEAAAKAETFRWPDPDECF